MAQKNINIGSGEQTGDGESLRSAFDKVNENFTDIYTSISNVNNDLVNNIQNNEVNDLTAAVIWANVPDVNITQSSVTQHQTALSITSSQVSDFVASVQNNEINDLTAAVTWANVPDVNITQSSVTQHQAALSITESQISDLQPYLLDITNQPIGDLVDVNLANIVDGSMLAWDTATSKWVIVPQGIQLDAISVTAPAAAFGSGGIDYNSTNGQFTYTPPDLSNFLTAETDTFQTITTRGNTTTNEVELNGGVKTNNVQSANGVHSIGFNEANDLTIGSTGGVKIIGAAAAPLELGTETSGTVTIGSGSNNIVFASTITGNVNGNVTGDLVGSVFADDSTVLVDGVAGKIVGDYENGTSTIGSTRVESYDIKALQDTNTNDLYVVNRIYGGETGAITTLEIGSDTTLLSNASIGADLTVTGDTNVGGNFVVAGDSSTTGNSTVAGNENIAGTLGVTGDATLSSNAAVGGDLSVAGNLSVLGNTDFNGTVDFTGATVTGTSFLTSETTTTLGINANILKYTDETGAETDIDLSLYLDDTNLARLTTGTLDSDTGIATFTRDDATTFTVDFSDLLNQSEANDLTASVTWANVPDANITQSSVTQHQAALSINESQILDLGNYIGLTDLSVGAPAAASGSGSIAYDPLTGVFTYTPPDILNSISLVSNTASGNGTLTYNSSVGQFTYTPPDLSPYLTAETNDLTTAVTWANVPDANITESSVTQHQAALGINESQITFTSSFIELFDLSVTQLAASGNGALSYNNSTGVFTYTPPDLSGYLTSEANDLTASVTWANIPPVNVPELAVTQHQSAITISESQITDLGNYATLSDISLTINPATIGGAGSLSYNNTTGAFTFEPADVNGSVDAHLNTSTATAGQILSWTGTDYDWVADAGGIALTDLSVTVAAAGSANLSYNNTTGVFTYTPPDLSSYLTSFTETNDLTSAVTWANVPDANITQSSVTQHQAALSITESQISDLQSYLTAETDPVFTAHTTSSITDGTGLLKNDGAGNWSYDNSTYLTSYTETNDLSSAVTWANVPDANITQSSVTQHQAALSITESQISDLGSYLTDLTGSSVGTLSDVDFNSVTLDGANGAGKVLAWDQTLQAFAPVDQSGGISNVVEDTTPQLGGNLDVNGNIITDTSGAQRIKFLLNSVNVLDIAESFGSTKFISPAQMNFETTDGAVQFSAGGSTRDIIFRAGSPLNDKFRIRASGGVEINAGSGNGYDLPATDGTAGQVMTTDGAGAASFVDGGDAVYTPTTSTDWNGTAPTTVGEAIDRLAALVKTLNGGTGA